MAKGQKGEAIIGRRQRPTRAGKEEFIDTDGAGDEKSW